MAKAREFWLTRDTKHDGGRYRLWKLWGKPVRRKRRFDWAPYWSADYVNNQVASFCPRAWHGATAPIKALRHGAGPIRVRVTIEAVTA